jgi:hypothetical protein
LRCFGFAVPTKPGLRFVASALASGLSQRGF